MFVKNDSRYPIERASNRSNLYQNFWTGTIFLHHCFYTPNVSLNPRQAIHEPPPGFFIVMVRVNGAIIVMVVGFLGF
jgi:hypothetical protein